jgi:peptidyl-prolyl cis-trans isomerase B (cyclophilin B)
MKILGVLILSLTITGCLQSGKEEVSTTTSQESAQSEIKENKARLKTTHGDIVFEFLKEDAPNTTARIKELIQQGFYNGLTFHRVIPGFVIQGGDVREIL